MLVFLICLFGILKHTAAVKDPFDFNTETCVKIFYTNTNIYNVYCLNYLEDYKMLGIVTDYNDTITFKRNPDITDESKICVNVFTKRANEKHCMGAISKNCLTSREDPKGEFTKTLRNVPCKDVPLEETQISCIGFSSDNFSLVFYCEPVIYYLRRTVFYVPDSKPKRE